VRENLVYVAPKGWDVDAYEFSYIARKKHLYLLYIRQKRSLNKELYVR
jgi:hypothetical protein